VTHRLAPLFTVLLALCAVSSAAAAHRSVHAFAAATCADFPNQAAAQRAHNTRDSDGDGIYCEDLPCPCLKPGQAAPQPRTPARQPSTFRGRCKRGALPDHSCSPGRVLTTDLARICTPGYSGSVRNVSERTKAAVFREYGIRSHSPGQYEVDHIISLELGGSNSIRNLYPEAAAGAWGFHKKDALENHLHALVCAHKAGLRTAQKAIASNWVKAYKRYMPISASSAA
jgi:hypothetical protein